MNTKLAIFISVFLCHTAYGQSSGSFIKFGELTINDNIVVPEDSLECEALLHSVDAFLRAAQQNKSNNWILPTQHVETQLLIDELQDIQRSELFENVNRLKILRTRSYSLMKN